MGVYMSRSRTDAAPKRASESDAEFLERIAGPFWDQVRDVINEWWSHFPPDAQPGLRSRLRDRNSDANVFSTMWELYVHEMLLGAGCLVEIEQQIGTGGKYPDFLVTRDDEQFIVEAIWTAESLDTTGNSSLPPQVVDAIDGVSSPNFYVAYKVDSLGSTTPQQRRLKNELTRWLASLDPDQVTAAHEQKVPLPRHTWQEAGWRLSFEAIPRSPGRRGDPTSRTIGFHPSAWVAEGSDRILKAVRKKGRKYGDLALPFIVAVGNSAVFPEDADTENALYGTSVEYVHRTGSTFGRNSDGYWTAAQDQPHSRVSGVLTVDNPAPWTWAKKVPALWQSPAPDSLPAPVLPTWESVQLVDSRVERQSAARPIHTSLGLPENWPIGEAFPRRRPGTES